MISGRTIVAGVVGSPIRHTLSPTIFNAWLEASGIDAVYVAFPVPNERFASFVGGLRGGIVRGLNVTAPFKQEAMRLADGATPEAAAAGAANLLVFRDLNRVEADNTDGFGVLLALKEQAPGYDHKAAPTVIFGAGGAARGVAAALIAAGAPQIRLVNRTEDRSAALSRALGRKARAYDWVSTAEALDGAGAAINCTPASAQVATLISAMALAPHVVILDMVYEPLKTPLLGVAEAAGLRAVDGLAILIAQARPSYEKMFNVEPPAIDVRAKVLALGSLDG